MLGSFSERYEPPLDCLDLMSAGVNLEWGVREHLRETAEVNDPAHLPENRVSSQGGLFD